MLKKSLIAIALVAFVATSAFAGQLKVEKPWPVAPIPQKACEVKVYLVMPYYIKLTVEPIKITLEQMIVDGVEQIDDWIGTAVDKDGKTPKVWANFECDLSTTITPTPEGIKMQGNLGKWGSSISPSHYVPAVFCTPAAAMEVTIKAWVYDIDLTQLLVCTTYHVATVNVMVVPSKIVNNTGCVTYTP